MLGKVAICALLLGFASWMSTARAKDELARLAQNVERDTSYQGMHSDFSDDNPVGRFMDLLAANSVVEAMSLRPQVCAAWTQARDTSPWSGRFSVNGVKLSLDRLCGLDRLKPH